MPPPSEFAWPIRVYYEDTDSSGVVYHANYLRFLERARTEWLRALGFSQEALRHVYGIAFTVADLNVVFRRPARLDDLLHIRVRAADVRRASFGLVQRIDLVDAAAGTAPMTIAQVTVACVNAASFKPRAVPRPVLDRIVTDASLFPSHTL